MTQTQGGAGHSREDKGAEVVRGWGAVATEILAVGEGGGERATGDGNRRRGCGETRVRGRIGTGATA